MPKGTGKIIANNKKAYHDFFIEKTYEAGLVLTGTEIKSIRQGKVSIKEAFARIEQGEAYLYNMHISEFTQGNRFNHEPLRIRKLLLNKKEINQLIGGTQEIGYALIPTKIYLKDGFAKVEIALARGKKLHDKREALKEKDAKRQIQRAFKEKQYD